MKKSTLRKLIRETILESLQTKETIDNPNFSIVVPGGCNCKCDFCFWQKNECHDKTKYLKKLDETLKQLPKQFYQISITGGEPTISPYFNDILKIVKEHKEKYNKVVLTTNGFNLKNYVDKIKGIVDHVNISYHHSDKKINESIFNSKKIISNDLLKELCSKLSENGIDVTINSVLTEQFKTKQDILDFIKFSRGVGAAAVAFRKKHSTLDESKEEKLFSNYKIISEGGCPVCRSKTQLIEGTNVTWKCSVVEPSNDLDKIYELVFQQDGKLTTDWEAKNEILIHTIKSNNRIFENKNILAEYCAGSGGIGSHCGEDYFPSKTKQKIKKIKRKGNKSLIRVNGQTDPVVRKFAKKNNVLIAFNDCEYIGYNKNKKSIKDIFVLALLYMNIKNFDLRVVILFSDDGSSWAKEDDIYRGNLKNERRSDLVDDIEEIFDDNTYFIFKQFLGNNVEHITWNDKWETPKGQIKKLEDQLKDTYDYLKQHGHIK